MKQLEKQLWWTIEDAWIRWALTKVESGEATPEEVYAVLCECADDERVEAE